MRGAATENTLRPIVLFVLGTKRSPFVDARRFDRAGMSATDTVRLLMYYGVYRSNDLWTILAAIGTSATLAWLNCSRSRWSKFLLLDINQFTTTPRFSEFFKKYEWQSMPGRSQIYITALITAILSNPVSDLFVHSCCCRVDSLPDSLKDTALSLSCFHSHLKTFLFSCY